MDTQTTVQDAEDELSDFVPPNMTFLQALNKVCNRLTYSGKWKGAFVSVVLPVVSEYITLPPRYMSVLAGTFDNFPVPTMSNWFTYMEVGMGSLDEALLWSGRIQDQQDGFVTQFDMTDPGSIRLYSTGSDNGAVIRINGTQSETVEPVVDNQGVEGESLTLSAPVVQSAYHYNDLTGAQKPLTKGPITVKVLPMGGGAEYEIGQWQSWETRPSYRRYKIGPAAKTVRVLCQRRFIKMISQTDWVIPGNIAALQCGLQALQYEAVGYNDSAKEQWDQAYVWLNQEAKSLRGGAQVPIPFSAWGRGNGIAFSN